MKDFEFIDTYFDVKHSSTYFLSIQLALDGFSFAIFDQYSNKFIVLKNKVLEYNSEINSLDYCQYVYDFLIEEEFFNYQFRAVNIIYISVFSTLIPTSIFIKEKAKQLFETNFGKIDEMNILSNRLKNNDLINVFAVPNCLLRILNRKFKSYKVFHQATPLIVEAILNTKNQNKPLNIYLNQNKNVCDFVVAKAGKLVLFNSYKYSSQNDILYFLANINEQIQSFGEVNEVVISGKIKIYHELETQIKQYFKNVNSFNITSQFSYSKSFGEFLEHEYSTLFKMPLCE